MTDFLTTKRRIALTRAVDRDAPTWNTCPTCGHRWTERVPIPGVVHRTTVCATCRRLAQADRVE